LRAQASAADLAIEVDSAGVGGWHAGEPPDHRAQTVARRHGIDISHYRARKVSEEDFRRFTHVIAMDRENFAALLALRPDDATAKLSLFLDHVEGRAGEDVDDPWYGSTEGFEITWSDVSAGAKALVKELSETP